MLRGRGDGALRGQLQGADHARRQRVHHRAAEAHTERPKRTRNQALFRDDNCSLSLGQNGKFYFVFSMPSEQLDELPEQLVRQASVIAGKFLRLIMEDNDD